MYFFFRKFEVDDNVEYYEKNRKILIQDVIECEDRNCAKKYIIKKYGNYPFRKNKNMKNGDIYYYLCDSNEYWYNQYHKIYHIKCENCGKQIKVVGVFNLIRNKYGEYCSHECEEKYYNKKRLENPWINKDDVLCVPKEYASNLVGYIYRITNKRTMKSYIGKTKNAPLFRWWQHLKSSETKFERENITDLVFEVLEIVTYDKKIDGDKYKDGKDKMSFREMFYITHFNTIEYGYNKMLEKTKIEGHEYQLQLNLEE